MRQTLGKARSVKGSDETIQRQAGCGCSTVSEIVRDNKVAIATKIPEAGIAMLKNAGSPVANHCGRLIRHPENRPSAYGDWV
jgi:hypothetical protein